MYKKTLILTGLFIFNLTGTNAKADDTTTTVESDHQLSAIEQQVQWMEERKKQQSEKLDAMIESFPFIALEKL